MQRALCSGNQEDEQGWRHCAGRRGQPVVPGGAAVRADKEPGCWPLGQGTQASKTQFRCYKRE